MFLHNSTKWPTPNSRGKGKEEDITLPNKTINIY